jgi:DNA-binding NtrC family response regulator
VSQKFILVVDDERGVADTLAAIMQRAGWRSRAAYCAEDAMEVLRTEEEPALMISDVIMPGINGVELSLQVRRRWPKVQILLISGNATTQEIVNKLCAEGHSFELLAKPVPPKQLVMKVASLLSDTNILRGPSSGGILSQIKKN